VPGEAVPSRPLSAGVAEPVAVVRAGADWIAATDPVEIVEAAAGDAFAALDDLTPGFWAGFASFELGHAVERVRAGRASLDVAPRLPDLCFVRFARQQLVSSQAVTHRPDRVGSLELGPADNTSLDRAEFGAAVETILEHIRCGDCYQVNLTRTITWDREADAGALFANLIRDRPAPHAALLRLPAGDGSIAVVSASPERFLAWDGRSVETRPIKGTAADPEWLRASAKDRAENVMIVDLARNDLGRVCSTGSIHVDALCAVELHPGLAHLVSTVRGQLRSDVGIGGLLRATFPPASVTGAPKPRVLQIIEDLETARRGVYCGAVGWIDTVHGRGDLAVAIRTFTVAHARTTLGVGSGIVADSIPEREWDETCLKGDRLLAAAGATDAHTLGVAAVRA
jgi:para-aminobenzoate synthetase component 1